MANFDDWSPKRLARLGAALSVLSGVPDGFSVTATSKVFVKNDVAATVANVLRSETVLRSAMVAELCALAIFVVSIVLLYVVFRAAGRRGALLFLVFSIMGATIQSLDVLGDLGALALLHGGGGAAPVAAATQATAVVLLRMHFFVYTVALVFIGFGSLCLTYLVTRATFLPRAIGYVLVLDGLGFLTASFASLVAPALAVHLRPFVPYVTAGLGEGALFLWLIIKGVDVQRWEEQEAGGARSVVPRS